MESEGQKILTETILAKWHEKLTLILAENFENCIRKTSQKLSFIISREIFPFEESFNKDFI